MILHKFQMPSSVPGIIMKIFNKILIYSMYIGQNIKVYKQMCHKISPFFFFIVINDFREKNTCKLRIH